MHCGPEGRGRPVTWRTSGEDSFAAGLRCLATDFEPAWSRYQARLKPRYGSLALARQGAAPERPGNAARPSGSGRPRVRPSRPPYLPEQVGQVSEGGRPYGGPEGGLKKPRPTSERTRPYLPRTLGGSCRAEKRGALPGGGLRRHGGAPGVGPRRPATRWTPRSGQGRCTLRPLVPYLVRSWPSWA